MVGYVNPLPAVVAASVVFLFGSAWYSPWCFGGAWKKLATPANEAKRFHPRIAFLIYWALTFISAYIFGLCINVQGGFVHTVLFGLAVGAGFLATALGINYMFMGLSAWLYAIDVAYYVGHFLIISVVFASWPHLVIFLGE